MWDGRWDDSEVSDFYEAVEEIACLGGKKGQI